MNRRDETVPQRFDLDRYNRLPTGHHIRYLVESEREDIRTILNLLTQLIVSQAKFDYNWSKEEMELRESKYDKHLGLLISALEKEYVHFAKQNEADSIVYQARFLDKDFNETNIVVVDNGVGKDFQVNLTTKLDEEYSFTYAATKSKLSLVSSNRGKSRFEEEVLDEYKE